MNRTTNILLMILLIPLLNSCSRMTSEEIANRDRAQTRMAERTERLARQHESALKAHQEEYWSVESIAQREDVVNERKLAQAEAEKVAQDKEVEQRKDAREAEKIRADLILSDIARQADDKPKELAEIAPAAVQATAKPKPRRLNVRLKQLAPNKHKEFFGNLKFFFCIGSDYSLVGPLELEVNSSNGEDFSKDLDLNLSDDQMKSGEIAVQGSIFVPIWAGDMQDTLKLESPLATSEGDNPCDKKLQGRDLVFYYIRNENAGKISMTWDISSQ